MATQMSLKEMRQELYDAHLQLMRQLKEVKGDNPLSLEGKVTLHARLSQDVAELGSRKGDPIILLEYSGRVDIAKTGDYYSIASPDKTFRLRPKITNTWGAGRDWVMNFVDNILYEGERTELSISKDD